MFQGVNISEKCAPTCLTSNNINIVITAPTKSNAGNGKDDDAIYSQNKMKNTKMLRFSYRMLLEYISCHIYKPRSVFVSLLYAFSSL